MKENYFYVLILISKFEVRRWNWNFVYRAHTSCEISLSEIYVYLNNAATFKVFDALFRAIDFKVRGSFFEKRKLTSRFFKCTALENTRLSRFKFVNSPSLISVRWRKAIDRFDTILPFISRKNCSFFNNFIAIILSWEMNH